MSSNQPRICAEQGPLRGKRDIQGRYSLPHGHPPKRKLPKDMTKKETAEKEDTEATTVTSPVSSNKTIKECQFCQSRQCID
jgi:hypothetical protein